MARPLAELAAIFDRANGPRLEAAERFLRAWPTLFGDALKEWELGASKSPAAVAAVARFEPKQLDEQVLARFAFWAREAGGNVMVLEKLNGPARAAVLSRVEKSPLRAGGKQPGALPAELDELLGAMGVARTGRAVSSAVVLQLRLGTANDRAEFDAAGATLFVRSTTPLPIGDPMQVSVASPEVCAASGRVTEGRAGTDAQAGFTLTLDAPVPKLAAAVRAAHSKRAQEQQKPDDRRAFQRFAVKAPARLELLASRHDSDAALAADWVENLSLGGALVRTQKPPPIGTQVRFEMSLPNGRVIGVPATVVRSVPGQAGVKFELDAESEAALREIVRKLSQRARRALVVDDDALMRKMLEDALVARGFEVLLASTGQQALSVLLDELFGLDVLVTDLWMPGLDGESVARTIRVGGGEQELIIVVITGRPGRPPWLEELRIDAMVDKAIGPEAMAHAIEAQVELRRGAASPGAAGDGLLPVLRVSYPSVAELLGDAPALTLGGVFVRGRTLPLQAAAMVHLVLPSGQVLRARGEVVSVEAEGVGVSFLLEPADREVLMGLVDRAIDASMKSW